MDDHSSGWVKKPVGCRQGRGARDRPAVRRASRQRRVWAAEDPDGRAAWRRRSGSRRSDSTSTSRGPDRRPTCLTTSIGAVAPKTRWPPRTTRGRQCRPAGGPGPSTSTPRPGRHDWFLAITDALVGDGPSMVVQRS